MTIMEFIKLTFAGWFNTTTSASPSAVCALLGAGISPVVLLAASTAPGLVFPLPGPVPFIFEAFRPPVTFPPPAEATVGDGLARWGVFGSCTELFLFKGRGGCFEPAEPCDKCAGLGFIFMRCDMLFEAGDV